MSDQLTQDVAERCARACWGEPIDDGLLIHWNAGDDGEWPCSCELPLDPSFWFYRLFTAMPQDRHWFIRYDPERGAKNYTVFCGEERVCDCDLLGLFDALCETIEALKGGE